MQSMADLVTKDHTSHPVPLPTRRAREEMEDLLDDDFRFGSFYRPHRALLPPFSQTS